MERSQYKIQIIDKKTMCAMERCTEDPFLIYAIASTLEFLDRAEVEYETFVDDEKWDVWGWINGDLELEEETS